MKTMTLLMLDRLCLVGWSCGMLMLGYWAGIKASEEKKKEEEQK